MTSSKHAVRSSVKQINSFPESRSLQPESSLQLEVYSILN